MAGSRATLVLHDVRKADIRQNLHLGQVPLTDIQLVADGDFGDLGILRVSWPFSRIAAITAISAAALV